MAKYHFRSKIIVHIDLYFLFLFKFQIPDHCPAGQFYNLTRGYIKIRGDTCVGGDAKLYEPHKVACPIKEEKEFLLLAGRTQIQRIDLSNLTYPEILPINTSNVITVVCN